MTANYVTNCKIVACGDGCVGKTCLLVSYSQNAFPIEHIPTVFDNYSAMVLFEGKPVNLNLWDTAGQEEYARLRPLSFPDTDCFLLCFAISSRNSFNNLSHKWVPELNHHVPHRNVVLCGLKSDLRDDVDLQAKMNAQGKPFVTRKEAEEFAKKIGAHHYVECSALHMDNVTEVFNSALSAAKPRKRVRPNQRCTIL